ncbi:hypothetical protein Hanom_Chr11g01045871 [Helianthus anomalus]
MLTSKKNIQEDILQITPNTISNHQTKPLAQKPAKNHLNPRNFTVNRVEGKNICKWNTNSNDWPVVGRRKRWVEGGSTGGSVDPPAGQLFS